MTGEDGKSKGFGFISFEEAEQAEAACDDLDSKEMGGKTLFVGRAQKKAERQVRTCPSKFFCKKNRGSPERQIDLLTVLKLVPDPRSSAPLEYRGDTQSIFVDYLFPFRVFELRLQAIRHASFSA